MLVPNEKVRLATQALFDQTHAGVSLDLARDLLLSFQKTVQEESTEDGLFYGSVKREAVLPIAANVAHVIRSEMTSEMIARGCSIQQLERLHKLGDALTGLAHALDVFAVGEDQPAYHDRLHNLMVLAVRVVRGRAQRGEGKGNPPDLLREMRDYVTAIGHDLGHDGSSNRREGVYRPAYLEKKSFVYMNEIFEQAQISAPDRLYIKRSLLATDPELPGQIALYAHNLHFGTGALGPVRGALNDKIESLPEIERAEMQNLMKAMERDYHLTESAMALKGADMAPSFGLDDALCLQLTRDLNREVVKQTPDRPILDEAGKPKPAGQLFVMLNFVGAELCRQATLSTRKPHTFLKARFVDPEMDRLFGPYLRYLQERVQQGAGAAGQGIAQQLAKASGADLTL